MTTKNGIWLALKTLKDEQKLLAEWHIGLKFIRSLRQMATIPHAHPCRQRRTIFRLFQMEKEVLISGWRKWMKKQAVPDCHSLKLWIWMALPQ